MVLANPEPIVVKFEQACGMQFTCSTVLTMCAQACAHVSVQNGLLGNLSPDLLRGIKYMLL